MMVLPFLAIYCTGPLGFSITQAGLVTGAYGAGSLCGSLIGGELTDRIGFYKVMVWSLSAAGIGMLFLPLFTTFYPLCLAVFITSTLGDAFRPATMTAIGHYSSEENQTRSISLIRMAFNLGIATGPAVGGFLALTAGYTWLFIIDGITCFAAAIFLVSFLPKSAHDRSVQMEEEIVPTKSVYSDKIYIMFLTITAINIIGFMQLLSTVPLFLKQEIGMLETQIGIFFTINGLAVFLLEMPLVSLAEKKTDPFTSMMIGALLIGIGNLTLNLDLSWLWLIFVYNITISVGEIINFPFGNTLALQRAPQAQKGKYMGLWATMFSIVFMIAPVIGTTLVDHFGFEITWWIIAGFSFVSIPGFIWIKARWSQG